MRKNPKDRRRSSYTEQMRTGFMYFIVPPTPNKQATGMGGSLEVGEHLRERGSSRVSSKVLSFSNI